MRQRGSNDIISDSAFHESGSTLVFDSCFFVVFALFAVLLMYTTALCTSKLSVGVFTRECYMW